MIYHLISRVKNLSLFSLLLTLCCFGHAFATPMTIYFSGIVTAPQTLQAGYTEGSYLPDEFVAGNRFTGTLTWDYLLISDFLQSGASYLAEFDKDHVLGITLTLGPQTTVLNDQPSAHLWSDSNGKGSFSYGAEGGLFFKRFDGTKTSAYFEHIILDFDYNDDLIHDSILPPDPEKMILTSLTISAGPFWRLYGTIDPAPAPVPEPSAFLLLCSGLGGLAIWRKRRGYRQ